MKISILKDQTSLLTFRKNIAIKRNQEKMKKTIILKEKSHKAPFPRVN
jgi:hypothetical protein